MHALVAAALLASVPDGGPVRLTETPDRLVVETDALRVSVRLTGYVSGTEGGTLVDKKTGAKDLGFGLHVMDFLLAPGWADDDYSRDPKYHGDLPKHLVEGPQICTQAKRLTPRIARGGGFVAVQFEHAFTRPGKGLKAGSVWRQTLVFVPGSRHFYSAESVTSANAVSDLMYRIDMPGHVKHAAGDTFEAVHLSTHDGLIPAAAFRADFAPDARFLYRRDDRKPPPARMVRAYKVKDGPWLAGITLDPAACSEAWCHQRGYVCFIQELHRRDVRAGDTFGAAYAVGWFDDVPGMNAVADRHKGATKLTVTAGGWKLE